MCAERDKFIRAIIDAPADDNIRLVFADWLEDRGDVVYSDFVRVQLRIAALEADCSCGRCVKLRGGGQHTNGPCAVDQDRVELPDGRSRQAFLRRRERELLARNAKVWAESLPPAGHFGGIYDHVDGCVCVFWGGAGQRARHWFRRGFVAEVRCTLKDWCGEKCGQCGGSGTSVTQPEQLRGTTRVVFGTCRACGGSGRVDACGSALVACQPVTCCVLTCRESYWSPSVLRRACWFRGMNTTQPDSAHLPEELFDLLGCADGCHLENKDVWSAPTTNVADLALSRAALRWHKNETDLPRPYL